MPCPRCGLHNPPGSDTCERCGLGLTSTVEGEQGQPASSPEPGPSAGSEQQWPQQQPSGYPAPAPPTQGHPTQSHPQQPYPQHGYAPQGYPPQGYAPQGYPPQGYPPQGYPPQGYPQQGYPPPAQPVPPGWSTQQTQSAYGGTPANEDTSTATRRPPEVTGYPGHGWPQQYGGQPTYGGGATSSAAWPPAGGATDAQAGPGATVGLVALALGALLAIGYAIWALTARRGIFADFADGTPVSSDDAQSSDRLDTVFLVAAGLVALVALALWIARYVGKKTKGGAPDVTGLAVAGIGVVVVLVGLFLAAGITDADGQTAQGDRGVTAMFVTAGGFLLLAIGFVIGLPTVRGPRSHSSNAARGGDQGQRFQNW